MSNFFLVGKKSFLNRGEIIYQSIKMIIGSINELIYVYTYTLQYLFFNGTKVLLNLTDLTLKLKFIGNVFFS